MDHVFVGIESLHRRQICNSSGHHGLAGFASRLGPSAGVVKRVPGVGEGARSSRTFVTPRNRNESSRTFAITAKVCQLQTSFSWHRCLMAIGLSRSISFPSASRFGATEACGWGLGRTHLRGARRCLTDRCRAPQVGNTPLHLAARNGHATVVKQLLAAGAVKDAKTKVRSAGDVGCRWCGVEGRHAAWWGILAFWLLFVSRVVLCLVKTCI